MSRAVLIIDDEATLAKNIKAYLERYGYEVMQATSGEEGLAKAESFHPDVLLLDYHLPKMNGLQVLAQLRRRDASMKIIMLTGHGNVEVAVQGMKAGAYDYLSKPVALSELKLLIDKAIGQDRMEKTLGYLCEKEGRGSSLEKLLGDSNPMAQLKDMMRRLIEAEYGLADNDSPSVLITGETGTGKELVARALHFEGPRSTHPFIEINCASIPSHLLEAELFGYERGAFTDARERKHGLVETADGGTLFLDEIGEIDLSIQTKLLKVLEAKTVRRLGGLRETRVNFRTIAATNQDLERLVQEGKFRSDLYFRLRTIHLKVPPLRMRGGDVMTLASAFLRMHGTRYRKPDLYFTREAEQALLDWAWPGNVRELRNALEQVVLMAQDNAIGADQFLFSKTLTPGSYTTQRLAQADPALPDNCLNLEQMERYCLGQALEQTSWNTTRAAKLLGLSRDTLRYRMEKYGLKNVL
jgi:two-component system response regulator AtoC